MRIATLLRILAARRRLRRHERWTRTELDAHQRVALTELRRFAMSASPFYAELHRGLRDKPLSDLPIVTKRLLLSRYDQAVTDPCIRLSDLQAHVEALEGDDRFLGRYRVAATSGSSGLKTIVPSSEEEWATIVGSYARANEWAGVRLSPFRPARVAVVSSRIASHQSARVARTIQTPLLDALRIDAADPIEAIIERLDRQQPHVLIAYASMLRALAEEQLTGALRIAPRAVNSSSEVFTSEARARVRLAWGVEPFEVYAATETGGIAAECDRHSGMHVFEDLVIIEPVDEEGHAVPAGPSSARLLVTVLFSRTLPLIRYELTDSVRLSERACSCGRPFRLIEAVDGRTDDALDLPAGDGRAWLRVHPKVFINALDRFDVEAWQVRQEIDGLRVSIAKPVHRIDAEVVRGAVQSALRAAGAGDVSIVVESVSEIAAGPSGKRPLVVALRGPSSGAR